MKEYKIKIEPEAFNDIQEITDWYNDKLTGLGKRFQKIVIKLIDSLDKDPQIYAIRYKEIRCMLVNKFPYMVHFYVNNEDNTVEVLAVISTDRNPKVWQKKIKRD